LQRLVLRTLLRKLSFCRSALVLDLLRLLGASVLDVLLTSVLLCREPQPSGGKNDRDGQGTKSPASLRLSIASSRTVSSSAMTEVYE
jgi:hypothetical protein